MDTRKYRIENTTRKSSLSAGVHVIDNRLEPLAVLKVLIEGLAFNEDAGLWLTGLIGIPMVPRLAPIDLLYLDQDYRVVEAAGLLPDAEFPAFHAPSVSALVLPYLTLTASNTQTGDQLVMSVVEDEVPAALPSAKEDVAPPIPRPVGPVAPPFPGFTGPTQSPVPLKPLVASRWAPAVSTAVSALAELELPTAPASVAQATVQDPSPAPVSASLAPAIQPDIDETDAVPIAPETQPEELVPEVKPEPREPVMPRVHYPVEELGLVGLPGAKEKQAAESAQEKEKVMSRFLRWLYPGVYENERRKARRRYSPYLVAYDTTGGKMRVHLVGDISSTGIYLVTEERWAPGETRSLTLQRYGPPEESPERKIELKAGTVRWGKNGVGLTFELPTGMALHLWEDPARIGGQDRGPDYILREFRLARALAFIDRICPQMVEKAKKLLEHDLSHMRVACAIELLLRAEEILSRENQPYRVRTHPEIVLRVLEDGSWAEVEWIQRFWSGLLATSCTAAGFDESNKSFIEILSKLTPMHARILVAVCARATKVRSGGGLGAKYPLYCTAEELVRISGSNDLSKVHRSIAQLADYGLLENSMRSSFIANSESAKTTPTELGLQMYTRCTGHRELI